MLDNGAQYGNALARGLEGDGCLGDRTLAVTVHSEHMFAQCPDRLLAEVGAPWVGEEGLQRAPAAAVTGSP